MSRRRTAWVSRWWLAAVGLCSASTACAQHTSLPVARPPADASEATSVPAATRPPGSTTTATTTGVPSPQTTEALSPIEIVRSAASARPIIVASAGPTPQVSLAFSGDILAHSPIVNRAAANATDGGYDFAPMFADVAGLLSAVDVAVCHLETPFAPPGESLSTFPQYGIPAEMAFGIASAGYDRCSTASNHTIDRGMSGVDATVNGLQAAGVAQSGMARTPNEAVPTAFTVNGMTIAHLSFTFSFNGAHLPTDQQWRSDLIDVPTIVAKADYARNELHADLVVVSLHWGIERQSRITEQQRAIASELTASPSIDLIVGHHAHVLQPIEQINGKWVIYGLGNFLSNMPTGPSWPASSQDGAIVTVTATASGRGTSVVSMPVVTPTWVDRTTFEIVHVDEALADPATGPGRRAELERSRQRTADVLGTFLAPAA